MTPKQWPSGPVAKWPRRSGPVVKNNTLSPCHSATWPLGQSTVETGLLLLVVTVALVTFFSFIRASVSSRLKTGVDAFGHGLLHEGN